MYYTQSQLSEDKQKIITEKRRSMRGNFEINKHANIFQCYPET